MVKIKTILIQKFFSFTLYPRFASNFCRLPLKGKLRTNWGFSSSRVCWYHQGVHRSPVTLINDLTLCWMLQHLTLTACSKHQLQCGVPISWQHRQHRRVAVDRQHPCDSTAALPSIDSTLATAPPRSRWSTAFLWQHRRAFVTDRFFFEIVNKRWYSIRYRIWIRQNLIANYIFTRPIINSRCRLYILNGALSLVNSTNRNQNYYSKHQSENFRLGQRQSSNYLFITYDVIHILPSDYE